MTLGKKLSGYRKIAGLTQQQLGERLNLSAQAISKWENDLAEPDLSTLRTLAELYKVSVDELLNLNDEAFENIPDDEPHTLDNNKVETSSIVGFCKTCGITVTEANLGTMEPVIMCKKCLDAKKEADRLANQKKIEAERRIVAEAQMRKNAIKNKTKGKLTATFVLAGIVAAAVLVLGIMGMASDFSASLLFGTLIATYAVFAFITLVRLETVVNDIFFDWTTKSFEAPGLIFELDLDGISWLIGMKILFWIIGALFALVCGAIGIILGLIISTFYFPRVMYNIKRDYNNGIESEYIDY